eukprot:scaffold242237_cov39-Prasinocladus_malaysianus.AAC.3
MLEQQQPNGEEMINVCQTMSSISWLILRCVIESKPLSGLCIDASARLQHNNGTNLPESLSQSQHSGDPSFAKPTGQKQAFTELLVTTMATPHTTAHSQAEVTTDSGYMYRSISSQQPRQNQTLSTDPTNVNILSEMAPMAVPCEWATHRYNRPVTRTIR